MKEKAWEYTGKTVEEATRIALEELGLERDDINVEVLEEPQRGFLGIGGQKARILVELIGEWEVTAPRKKKSPSRKEEEREPVPQEKKEKAPRARKAPAQPAEELPPVDDDDGYEPATSDNALKVVNMLEDILEIMKIEASVEAKEKEESIVADIFGEDIALLIGRNGTTLDAIQYLVNVTCRKGGEPSKRIIVDVEGYRKRRKAKIEKQAEEAAEKAAAQNRSVELPPMNSAERKIVHMALRGNADVYTESAGDGPERRVVIRPSS